MDKPLVVFIGGGEGSEHEVSLRSLHSVFTKFQTKLWRKAAIVIDKKGRWYFDYNLDNLITHSGSNNFLIIKSVVSQGQIVFIKRKGVISIYNLKKKAIIDRINVVFPLIHGTFGEDGCLQGYLELLGVPYVGANVLSSALGMDKEFCKKILQQEKIKTAPFLTLKYTDTKKDQRKKIHQATTKFGFPLFVKPASLGSSVGVTKVYQASVLGRAILNAFRYDNKILLEKFIRGREIECAVLGNNKPKASLPGEIQPREEFYSYSAKYLNKGGANLLIPAPLDQKMVKKIQNLSLRVYQVLEIYGMARIDLFLKSDQEIIVNEVNTIPGFTDISMYPKLWEISGMPYSVLLETLINLALETQELKKRLERSR